MAVYKFWCGSKNVGLGGNLWDWVGIRGVEWGFRVVGDFM